MEGCENIDAASVLDMAIVNRLVADLGAQTAFNLVAGFVDEMIARTDRIAQAAARGDCRAVQHEAHALKSTAGTYGAREVARAAEEIEVLCRGNHVAATERLAGTLPSLSRRAAEAYANWRARLE